MEKLEERITNILDALTADVKIEDAAILMGGFYAGMQGYTPLTSIMKIMSANGAARNPSLSDAFLRLPWGIPGLLVESLFLDSSPSVRDQALLDRQISIDDMDPRRITSDYLYERLIYLKDRISSADQDIKIAQERLDQYQQELIIAQDLWTRYSQMLGQGHPRYSELQSLEQQIIANNDWIQRLIAEIERLKALEPTDRIAELIKTYVQALNDAMANGSKLVNDFHTLKLEIEQWVAQTQYEIDRYMEQINHLKNDIAIQQEILKEAQEAPSKLAKDLPKINKKFLEKKIALGLIGMIEAYTLTRPGAIGNMGEILKGIGEIVPL